MIIPIACIVAIAAIAWVLVVRPKDLPAAEAESPTAHLTERKAAIYENLRDLQFEYRLGKLSDLDYQSTKKDLQKELAGVLAEIDKVNGVPAPTPRPAPAPAPASVATVVASNGHAPVAAKPHVCPSCNAGFDVDLKFCGECGKPMKEAVR